MPKVAKGRRKRAYAPKTTSGCLTCKARRIKCDEARPACQRCISTRRVCDGYRTAPALCPFPKAIVTDPIFEIQPTRSRRSFTFFVQRTCLQLAGFFGSEFWQRFVLQAVHYEPAVRHAVVALGALHEILQCRATLLEACETFALEQYNLAIRGLLCPRARAGRHGINACLIVALLFATFETMRGNHASAMSHTRSGAKLLRETIQGKALDPQTNIDWYAPLELLAMMFASLDQETQNIITNSNSKLFQKFYSDKMFEDRSYTISSIEEAKISFEYGNHLISNRQFAMLSGDTSLFPGGTEAHVKHCANMLSRFSFALQDFVEARHEIFTKKEDTAVKVLRLHILNAYVGFNLKWLSADQREQRDGFINEMQEMVALGGEVITATSRDECIRLHPASFCTDKTGVIIPLWTVASLARDYKLRHKAIALLRSIRRQEGLWNSLQAAEAAEKVMEIEKSSETVRSKLWIDAIRGQLHYSYTEQDDLGQVSVVQNVFSWCHYIGPQRKIP